MLRTIAKVGAAATVLAAATFLPASPVSSQDAGPTMGYTLLLDDEAEACRLATIDLNTATVAALPAAVSDAACVNDLAVAPDGTVWGIRQGGGPVIIGPGDELIRSAFTPQAESPLSLVAFDPTTGAVTREVTIDIPGEDGDAFLPDGGLAITPDGTVWALFGAEACDSGNQNCLWTIDPASGAASLVGDTDTFQVPMFGLAACSAGVVTLQTDEINSGTSTPAFVPNPDVGFLDPATGKLTGGPTVADTVIGYDCSGTSGWALTGEGRLSRPDASVPQAVDAVLTTFDPATGTLTEIAAVTPADDDVILLAVAPTTTPAPTTTTTAAAPATTAAAQPAVVTPRFTG